jgi:hypothetical protein
MLGAGLVDEPPTRPVEPAADTDDGLRTPGRTTVASVGGLGHVAGTDSVGVAVPRLAVVHTMTLRQC